MSSKGWQECVQISTRVTNDVLPILREQPGFVDFFALSDKTNAERLLVSASGLPEKMLRSITAGHYETIRQHVEASLGIPSNAKDLPVSASTAHRIARAA
jgi:hypothetical protein